MSIYFYWGDDDFALSQAVDELRQRVNSDWIQFNYQKIPSDSTDAPLEALNQAMTPPFGMGERLVWLADSNICNQCSKEVVAELERSLPAIPPSSNLLITSTKKPDGRSSVTKLLKKHAEVREFPLISPWQTDLLLKRVKEVAQALQVKLDHNAESLLAESVGNDTRRLWGELEKLKLYEEATQKPLNAEVVSRLVVANTQSSLQLATAIRNGKTGEALGLVTDLIYRNEPALRISATLVGQFRTWTMVRLMVENGERDEKVIASAAEVGNPKRIYFLRKEVASLSSEKLLKTLPILLELEVNLKRGVDALSTLQTKVVELCQVCR